MDNDNVLKDLFLMQQTYATLFSVYNKLQTESDKHFVALSSRQYMTMLAILHLSENETTINSIAKKLGSTKQNTKQLITVLEKKGYINIKPSDIDKRATNISITTSGINEMLKSGEIGIMFLGEVFNEFTGEELQTLWDLLKKIYRFDGKEQDGFENDPCENIAMDETAQEAQAKALQAFIDKRKRSDMERGYKE